MPSPLPDEEILDALRSAAPTPPPNLLERWQPSPPPRARAYRPWIAGFATAAAVGVATAFLPGSLLHPTPTFADVEDAMLQAKTVSWTERWSGSYALYPDGRMEKTGKGSCTRHWADLRIPAIAREGQRSKVVSRDGLTFQISSGKDTMRTYQVGEWSLFKELATAGGKPRTDQLRAEIINTSVVLSRTKASSSEWKSGYETIDGHRYLKLTRIAPEQPEVGKWRIESTAYSFWVDPETRRIFQRETRQRFRSPLQVVEMISVCDDYRYDETPPAGLFDIQPPTGTRYVYIPQPDRKIKPEDQQAMEAVVRKAEKAWNAGDASAYLSLWRFDYPTSGSSHAAQLAAIRNPKRYRWPEAARSYQAGVRSSGVYTHHAGDVFPPKDPVEFGVGFWGLLKESDGFKIVRVLVPNL